MLRRFWNRFWFELERFVVRGPLQRVVFIGVAIALISVIGGLIAVRISPFDSTGDAVWWAFLRLTDPGYLGDDRGAGLRTLSTIITVLGYVVFLGALIAIMTQWLNATMARLESGLTPIAANNHVVILGYSSRTASIVRELLTSEARVARFLRARGAGRLKIVILANVVDMKTVQDLKDRLGDLWRPRQIVLRSGTPLRMEHLNRVDYQHAAAILLPSSDAEGGDATSMADGRTIKALLATSSARREGVANLPFVVAEIVDGRRAEIAQRAYEGPSEILATDGLVARLIAQTLREPGITAVYEELLAPAGEHEIFVRPVPEVTGVRFWSAVRAFDRAVPIGVIRRTGKDVEAILAPRANFVVEAGDEMVFVAREFDDCEPSAAPKSTAAEGPRPFPRREARPRRKVLVLGWSHKVPAFVRELALDPSPDGPHRIDVFSTRPTADREAALRGETQTACSVRQLEGDFAISADLEALDPGSYDTIVFMASDRLDSPYESDARTILGHLVLEKLFDLKPPAKRPSIVVELMSSENAELLGSRYSEKIVSPVIMSHILTQVALRRELHAVYVDLFGSGGGELLFRPASAYAALAEQTFTEIQIAAAAVGEVALGVRRGGVVELCPDPKSLWKLGPNDEIVAVARLI